MKTSEELLEEISDDSRIEKRDLPHELVKCPQLMAKYLRYFHDYKKALIRGQSMMNEMVVNKQNYYTGQATANDYGKRPFNLVLKNQQQVENYIKADEDVIKLRENIDNTELLLGITSDMIETLKYRSNHLATIHDIRKFESGA